jgi:hypothetical protein
MSNSNGVASSKKWAQHRFSKKIARGSPDSNDGEPDRLIA